MNIRTMVLALAALVASATPVRAELRHVELKTLGMD